MMEISLKGKRALVTGAGRGIGSDVCRLLVKMGAQVVGLSRTESDLIGLKKEIGDGFSFLTADIGNVEQIKEVILS